MSLLVDRPKALNYSISLFNEGLIATLLLLLLFLVSPGLSDSEYKQVCGNTGDYTANSSYDSNLGKLLTSLSSNGSVRGFFNNTVGSLADKVYGLALCRGDTNTSMCQSCLAVAKRDILQLCPYNKNATIWYDYCILSYSNQNFLLSVNNPQIIYFVNPESVIELAPFNEIISKVMDYIFKWAAYNSTRRFATGEAYFNMNFTKIYGLAQCTPDLSEDQCYGCLHEIVVSTSDYKGKRGWRALGIRCNLRFEAFQFFEGKSSVQLAYSQQVPAPVTPTSPSIPMKKGKVDHRTKLVLVIVLPVITLVVLLSAIYIYFLRKQKVKKMVFLPEVEDDQTEFAPGESRLFDLNDLKDATGNFSDTNMLGEGGFGPVYKGALKDGQEIAVKRLSRTSGQGLSELRNEVIFVAKLQHRNLVRLLGCCLEEKEKLLVYEYLTNTSPDKFLFDPIKSQLLDWSKRYNIIEGISKGLLYLHEDSHLRIIHRDLKASNILLDGDMNPKISDFGLAKHFGVNETHGNTCRIAGTYGYMAPEYLLLGEFSTKSDVFSYGVLVLEIVTGLKNTSFQRSRPATSFLNHVWRHWNDGRALELRDHVLDNNFIEEQMSRCIHIGLLCVQEDPTKRPKMASVVHMLSSYSIPLPTPCSPAFLNFISMVNESEEISNENVCCYSLNSQCTNGYSGNIRMIAANEVSIC